MGITFEIRSPMRRTISTCEESR